MPPCAAPRTASALGKPNAGNERPASGVPASARYSNIPQLATYSLPGASAIAKGSHPTRTEPTTWCDRRSMAAMRKFA